MTAEEFQNRVIQARTADVEAQKDEGVFCKACKKFFKTTNSHDQHLNSKKHRENEKNFLENHVNQDDDVRISVPAVEIIEERRKQIEAEEDDDAESVSSDEWGLDDLEISITKSDCLFCDHHSKNMVKNLKHMAIAHSFFIPDAEYCSDVEALLAYLAEKICKEFICLWCNEKGRTFYSLQSVRQHMIEKGHTKMLHEGSALAEYVEYYDYSSSYPDHDDVTKDVDAEFDPAVLDGDEYQLVLPSGNVIGHRSLMRYYKQRINPNRAVVVKSDKKLHRVMAQYRALGMGRLEQESVARKARDIHMMKRTQAKLYMKVGYKANKLQHHYREQVNF